MLQGIIEMSSRNQIIMLTPFTLAGAMAPVTIAGALAQQNAEALAGIAFTQMVRPGAPVVYGGFTSNVDMKTGAPAFGTPEYMKAVLAGGQLCRKYGIPYRTSNVCAANTVDAQAAYESVFSLWAVIQGGGNFIMHSAGWMEGGLTCFVREVHCRRRHAADGGRVPDAARCESGRAGAGCRTRCRSRWPLLRHRPYAGAIRERLLFAHRLGLAQFRDLAGSRQPDRVTEGQCVWQKELAAYERPPMDAAIEEELDAFVAGARKRAVRPPISDAVPKAAVSAMRLNPGTRSFGVAMPAGLSPAIASGANARNNRGTSQP